MDDRFGIEEQGGRGLPRLHGGRRNPMEVVPMGEIIFTAGTAFPTMDFEYPSKLEDSTATHFEIQLDGRSSHDENNIGATIKPRKLPPYSTKHHPKADERLTSPRRNILRMSTSSTSTSSSSSSSSSPVPVHPPSTKKPKYPPIYVSSSSDEATLAIQIEQPRIVSSTDKNRSSSSLTHSLTEHSHSIVGSSTFSTNSPTRETRRESRVTGKHGRPSSLSPKSSKLTGSPSSLKLMKAVSMKKLKYPPLHVATVSKRDDELTMSIELPVENSPVTEMHYASYNSLSDRALDQQPKHVPVSDTNSPTRNGKRGVTDLDSCMHVQQLPSTTLIGRDVAAQLADHPRFDHGSKHEPSSMLIQNEFDVVSDVKSLLNELNCTDEPPLLVSESELKIQPISVPAYQSMQEDEIASYISRRKKSVRFQSESLVQVATSVPFTLSSDDIAALWWSKDEQLEIKRTTQFAASRFLALTPEYRWSAEQLLRKCRKQKIDSMDSFSYEEALRIVVNHDERGSEQTMIKSLKLQRCEFYCNVGKESVARLLDTQKAMKSLPNCSADVLSNTLAMQHHQFADAAARFARVLGDGDAKVAAGVYEDNGDLFGTNAEAKAISKMTSSILRTLSTNVRIIL